MSDDGRSAITIIAMLGSVFSPYYARARARGAADPLMHCAMNVALYGPRADRWALTERPRGAVFRAPRSLAIGPSVMEWSGGELRVAFDEIAADPGSSPRLLRTYEDTPFYARSLAAATFGGKPATVVHEALSLDRFASPWVQFLLPFRMRRAR